MGEYLFIGSAVFSAASGVVLFWINPKRTINRILFASSAWIAIWHICVFMAIRAGSTGEVLYLGGTLIFWLRLSSGLGAFLVWILWLMRAELLNRSQNGAQLLIRSWPAFLASAAIGTLVFWDSFYATPANETRGASYIAYTTAVSGCCVWALLDSWRQLKKLSGIRRLEMQFFLVGTITACLAVMLSHVLGAYFHAIWLRRSGPIWFTLLHGITIWTVCYHRIFDAKQIILSLSQRIGLLVGLGFFAAAIFWTIKDEIPEPWSTMIVAAATSWLAIAIDRPVRRKLGLDPEHAQRLPRQRLIEWARQIPDEKRLQPLFEGLLRDICQTNSATLLSRTDEQQQGLRTSIPPTWEGFEFLCRDGWVTPESAVRVKSAKGTKECISFLAQHQLGAVIAVPRGSNNPSLIIALGHKSSLRPYTFPDLQVIMGLAELMDNILIHARASAQVARIEKMGAAMAMSRALAHDLNNLATPIAAFLDHFEQKVESPTLEFEVLSDAKHSLGVMRSYIRESLFFARQLKPELTEVSTRSLLAALVRVCHERATSSDILIKVADARDVIFEGDQALLLRLMQNLVLNAIDASPPGSCVEIKVVETPDGIALLIEDQGAGIPAEIRDQIFEPYFTTKNSETEHRGFGLGLAIARKIAGLHDGDINVSSNIPSGSVFRVTLPKRISSFQGTANTQQVDDPISRPILPCEQEPQLHSRRPAMDRP